MKIFTFSYSTFLQLFLIRRQDGIIIYIAGTLIEEEEGNREEEGS
jgi:hypothetical protein